MENINGNPHTDRVEKPNLLHKTKKRYIFPLAKVVSFNVDVGYGASNSEGPYNNQRIDEGNQIQKIEEPQFESPFNKRF